MAVERRVVNAWIETWDARAAFPGDFDVEAALPASVAEIVDKLGGVIATQGTAVVLPGPNPWQAVVITVEGTRDGAVVPDHEVELD